MKIVFCAELEISGDKLRKYVLYTYGCPTIEDDYGTRKETDCDGCILHTVHRNGDSSRKGRMKRRNDSISLYKKPSLRDSKSVSSKLPESTNDSTLHCENMAKQQNVGSCKGSPQSQHQESSIVDDNFIPPSPSLEINSSSEMDLSDILKNLRILYDYNTMLRDKLLAAQSLLNSSSSRHTSPVNSTVNNKET